MILVVPLLAILSGAQAAAPEREARPAPAATRVEPPLRGKELLDRAASELVRLRRGLAEVLSRVEDARNERDIVKLLCADDKLSRVKVLVTVAEHAEASVAEAVATQDESVMIEYSKIAIARGKVDALRAEAAACIGQLAYEVEERTTVVVEEPEYLPKIGLPERAQDAGGVDPYRHSFGIPSSPPR
jgi:hypothetical protein